MFRKHVSKLLSAYCHGELEALESSRVTLHVQTCSRCRAELEQIRIGIDLAERLPTVSAPESLWKDIEPLLKVVPLSREPKRRFVPAFTWQQVALASAGVFVALVAVVAWYLISRSSSPWEVVVLDPGYVQIGDKAVYDSGELSVGEYLETRTARVKIKVGKIGDVDVDLGSRVRVIQARPLEHRLGLEHGRLHARIWAPPKLFFVNTPWAEAVDLGCEYTLEVNDAGDGFLRVVSGFVQLVLGGRESTVPAEAACATRAGIGPGTPYFEDASDAFRSALEVVDFGSGNQRIAALNQVLSEARRRDSLTLWHLLSRVDGEERGQVYDRLAELVPPPEGVTRQGIMALDGEMLESWFFDVQTSWFN